MTYFVPYVDAAGLHLPTYQDILDDLTSQMMTIYGNDIYLENDSSDYQFLSALALKDFDTMQAIQLAYNNRGPVTATGSGLDIVVAMNGLTRQSASYSTCQVTITGVAGTTITAGIVKDVNDYKWDLPANTIIPIGGTTIVSATCETIGAISAAIGEIDTIFTPQSGWTSVTNASSAVEGQPVETDAQLRARQAVSTELPSQTMVQGTVAAILALTGVTRSKVYENPTGAVDTYGHPAHSITCVVEGDTDANVAQAIYDNKSPGCLTNGGQDESPVPAGSTTVTITGTNGVQDMDISFYRPTLVDISVHMHIYPMTGYTADLLTDIQSEVYTYLNSLEIGETMTISGLYGVALSLIADLSRPTFSIKLVNAVITSSPLVFAAIDIDMAFNEVSQGTLSHITIVEVA